MWRPMVNAFFPPSRPAVALGEDPFEDVRVAAEAEAEAESGERRPGPQSGRPGLVALGALGVVYGDIGTSPLYAFREALGRSGSGGSDAADVYGVVSLLLWALLLVVTLKYVIFLLRADNHGEGGILSLFALVQSALGRRTPLILVLAIGGAALFYGDAIITPAISVLSALEGLEIADPGLAPFVVPLSALILVILFAAQRRGTAGVSSLFGPVMLVWFLAIGLVGLHQVVRHPEILWALDPAHALSFLFGGGFGAFIVLGSVFLAITGAEALYADLGHFGRKAIQRAWFAVVFPALALTYLAQGSLVLSDASAATNPFFLLVPSWGLLPLILLATVATIIASQAVLTGAASLTWQAVQLGFLPPLRLVHTSAENTSHIYLPLLNLALLIGVVALVVTFRSSSALAAAYGIAVTGTMVITSILAFLYLRHGRGWRRGPALAAISPILLIELCFLTANLTKIPDGGYLPILIAGALMIAMWTWSRGRDYMLRQRDQELVPLIDFISSVDKQHLVTVPGTAVFLTGNPKITPVSLLQNVKHNHVLHTQVIIANIQTTGTPFVWGDDRVRIEHYDERFVGVVMRFGFMEQPSILKALAVCRRKGLKFEVMSTSFFLLKRKLVADPKRGLPLWQDRILLALAAISSDPIDHYALPRDRVVAFAIPTPV